MPFATTELAERVERAERDLLEGAATAIGLRREVELLPVAGGLAAYTGPGSPLNKVAGLGFGRAPTDEELDALEAMGRRRGVPVQVELASLGDPALGRALTARGYRLVGHENVSGRALDDTLPAPPEHVAITSGDEVDLEAWIDAVVTGFATPDGQGVASHEAFPRDVLEGVVRDMMSGADMVRYGAHLDGAWAGGGNLSLQAGVAQLVGAATLPAHRRRGVQTALLRRRLLDARDAGCELAVVTTQPGSRSQENLHRAGFELLYARAILVLDAGAQ